jgi:hypothetical protein
MRPQEVVALGKEAGFPRATVYRAREKLGEAIEELGSGPRDPGRYGNRQAVGVTWGLSSR